MVGLHKFDAHFDHHGECDRGFLHRDDALMELARLAEQHLAGEVVGRGLLGSDARDQPVEHVGETAARTGRAGRTGTAASLVMGSEENRLAAINNYRGTAHASVSAETLPAWGQFTLYPPMVTLSIGGGKRDTLRPGDILGALTASKEIEGIAIGKITVLDKITYVAITQECAKKALSLLNDGKIKGKRYQARRLR